MKKKNIKIILRIIFATSIIIILFFNGLYLFKVKGVWSSNPQDYGLYGSYVGGAIGSILTFLTILILLLTMYLQNRANQKNIKYMRKQLKEQKTYNADSIKILNEQLDKERKQLAITIEHYERNDALIDLKNQIEKTENMMNSLISDQEYIQFIKIYQAENGEGFKASDDYIVTAEVLVECYKKKEPFNSSSLIELLNTIVDNDKPNSYVIVFPENLIARISNLAKNVSNIARSLTNYMSFNISHTNLCILLTNIFSLNNILKNIIKISFSESDNKVFREYEGVYEFYNAIKEEKLASDCIEYDTINYREVKKYIWNEMIKFSHHSDISLDISFDEFIQDYKIVSNHENGLDEVYNQSSEKVFSICTYSHYDINKRIWKKMLNDDIDGIKTKDIIFCKFRRDYLIKLKGNITYEVFNLKTGNKVFEFDMVIEK